MFLFLFVLICCVELVKGQVLPLGSLCSPMSTTSTCTSNALTTSNVSVSCCIPTSSISSIIASNITVSNITGTLLSLYRCTPQANCLIPTCGLDTMIGNVGNGVCKNGMCCSQAGFCGTTAAYCQNPAPVLRQILPLNSSCVAPPVSSGFAVACMSNYSCCYAPSVASTSTTMTTTTTTTTSTLVNTTTVITQKLPPLTCQLTNQCAPTTCGQGQRGNGLCAPQFGCCSQFNFCGFTSAYCSIITTSLIQPVLFVLPSSLSVTLLSLIAITTVLCIAVIVVLYRHRTSKLIRATSFQFSIITCMGLLIGCACGLVLLWDPSEGNNICTMRPWFTVIALYLVLAPLFLKTYRLNRIFAEKIEVVCITATDLYKGLALLIVIPLVLLLSFTAANPNSFTLTTSTASTATATMEIVSVPGCAYNSIEVGMLVAYMFILIVWGLYMAVRSRDVPPVFNESVHILFVLAFLFVYMSLLLPLQLLLTVDAANVNSATPSVVVLLRVGGILVAIWVVLCSLFGPKLLRIYTDTHEKDVDTRPDWWQKGNDRKYTTTHRNTTATAGAEMSNTKRKMETEPSMASPSQSSSPFQLTSSSSSPSTSSPSSPAHNPVSPRVTSPSTAVKKSTLTFSLAHMVHDTNAPSSSSYQSEDEDYDDERNRRRARQTIIKSQNEKMKRKSKLRVPEASVENSVTNSAYDNNERQHQSNERSRSPSPSPRPPPPQHVSAAIPPPPTPVRPSSPPLNPTLSSSSSYSSSSSSSPPPLPPSVQSSSSFSPSLIRGSPPPPPLPLSSPETRSIRPSRVSTSTTDVISTSPLHESEQPDVYTQNSSDNEMVDAPPLPVVNRPTPPPPPPLPASNMFLPQASMMSSVALEAARRVANRNMSKPS